MTSQAALTNRLATSLQRAMHGAHTYTETLADQRVRNGNALGFVELDGPGEAVAHVDFPMYFMERPVFTFGLELGDNSWLTLGDFPIATATAAAWTTRLEAMTTMYTGVTLGIVTTGITGKAIIHYSFQARSFTNPTGSLDAVGGTL